MASLDTTLASRSDAKACTKACSFVPEPWSPDNGQTTSWHLESSQERQDVAANESEERESDSGGDSVFITQSAVPAALRSARRQSARQKSLRTSPRVFPENFDASSSSSDYSEELKTKIMKLTRNLPKYNFSFLNGQKGKRRRDCITYDLNDGLHRSAMRGFFRCAKELQEYNTPPTSVIDEMDLDPLPEEGEEGPVDKDIKVVERKCFVIGIKAKTSKTWWNQAKEARKGQVLKSRQQNKQKVNTSGLYPQSEDLQSSEDEDFACSAKNTQRAKIDRKTSATGQLVQRRISKRLQQKAHEEETSTDSDATGIEQPEEESVSTPQSRGEPAEGSNPTEAGNIVKETMDNTTEHLIYPTSHELQYIDTSWVQGSCHNDTVVALKERGTAEAKQKNTNNKSTSLKIRTRRILFQQKAHEEEMCDDSDATVCEPNEEESVCPPLRRDPSTAAKRPAQVLCADDQSQTKEGPESQSFPQPLPMSTIMHDVDNDSPSRQTRDRKKTQWVEGKESAEVKMVQVLVEPRSPYLAAVLNVVEDMSSLLKDTTEPPACHSSDEMEYYETCLVQGSSYDTEVAQNRSTPKVKPMEKKKDKSTAQNIRTMKLFQENAQGDNNGTVYEPNEEENVSPPNDRDSTTAAEDPVQLLCADDHSQPEQKEDEPKGQTFLQPLRLSTVIRDVNNDNLSRRNKDRKKKRKKVEESAEDEVVHIQGEPEGSNLAGVPNVVEETSSLLNSSVAKRKKKKKDKNTAQTITMTLIQENVQDGSNAKVCEPNEEHNVSPPIDRVSITAAYDPTLVLCANDHSQPGQTEDEPESQSLLQPLPMSTTFHGVNNDRPGRKTKDRKKKKRKKFEESEEDEMVPRQEESDDRNLTNISKMIEETSSLLDKTTAPPVCPTNDELKYNDRSDIQGSSHDGTGVVQEDRSTLKAKSKKKKKEKGSEQNIIPRRTLLQGNARAEMCDDSDATVCELHDQDRTSFLNNKKDALVAAGVHDQSQQEVREEKSECSSFLPNLLTSIIHGVSNDSLCGKTKHRKKKKRKKGEESSEEDLVQTQQEPEGPNLADVSNVVEETCRLLDNSAAKPKKKKKVKGTAQNIRTMTLFEENAADDSNATVCEANEKASLSPLNDNNPLTTTGDPCQVLCADDRSQPGQKEDEPESHTFSQPLPLSTVIHNVNNDNPSGRKKDRKKKRKKVEAAEDKVLHIQEEPEGPNLADVPNVVEKTSSLLTNRVAKPKKKKKDKNTAHARWVENRNSDADVRMGVCGDSVCCSDENGDQKKKKRKGDNDNEQLLLSPSDKPPDDGGFNLKKKKQKKDKATTDERNESTNTVIPLEKQNGSKSIWTSKEANDYTDVKKKKHKKPKQLCGDTGAPERENVLGMSFWLDPATSGVKNESCVKKNKRGKAICDEGATPVKSEQVLDNPQNIAEGPEDENVHKKKKKKRKDNLGLAASIESLVQSADSVSAQRKKKKQGLPLLLMSRKMMHKHTKTRFLSG